MAFESILRRFHARFQRGRENAVLTRPCHDGAEERRQHPAGAARRRPGCTPFPASVARLSQAPHELPQARREQPHLARASERARGEGVAVSAQLSP